MTDVSLVGGTPEARIVLRALLALHHVRVRSEGQGLQEARKLLREGLHGILLVDAEMADGSWEEVVKAAVTARPRPRVVLMSPSNGARLEAKAKRLGVSVVLSRPFDILDLLGTLRAGAPPGT